MQQPSQPRPAPATRQQPLAGKSQARSVMALYGGQYLTAAEYSGQTHDSTITDVGTQSLNSRGLQGQQVKLVLGLDGFDKPLVLNKTNAMYLADHFGDDPMKWLGRKIRLSTVKVQGPQGLTDGFYVQPLEEQ